jgi:thiamine-phosphate diphosphorylase
MDSPHNNVIQLPSSAALIAQHFSKALNFAHVAGFNLLADCLVKADSESIILSVNGQHFQLKAIEGELSFTLQLHNEHSQIVGELITKHTTDSYSETVNLPNGQSFQWLFHPDAYRRDTDRFIAWFILGISLQFSFEDSALIARSAQSVSCETWPVVIEHYPQIANTVTTAGQRKVIRCQGLYPVVDTIELVEELAQLDIDIIQLRIKDKVPEDVSPDIQKAIELGNQYGVDVVINDYWQQALNFGAACLHLGQEDLAALNDSQVLESHIGLGISTHGYFEILNALQYNPSYLALGHIYPTPTKDMPSSPQGLVKLRLYQLLIDSISQQRGTLLPTVAIGGIDLGRAPEVIESGVASVAVVRAVTQATNKEAVVDSFQLLFDKESKASGVIHAI